MANHRPRRPVHLRLRRSVEEAMRQRLSNGAEPGKSPGNGELFPEELDRAIDQALNKLGTKSTPSTGG